MKTNPRGTKRMCRNEECALPFYDLNREAPTCPACGTEFDVKAAEQEELDRKAAAEPRKPFRQFTSRDSAMKSAAAAAAKANAEDNAAPAADAAVATDTPVEAAPDDTGNTDGKDDTATESVASDVAADADATADDITESKEKKAG